MQRFVFKMKLLPGNEAVYQQRHDAIWPELATLLKQSGIKNYSIFLDTDTLTLFAYLEAADDTFSDTLPLHPIMKKWWQCMKDIMETNDDGSPVSTPLKEVFYLP